MTKLPQLELPQLCEHPNVTHAELAKLTRCACLLDHASLPPQRMCTYCDWRQGPHMLPVHVNSQTWCVDWWFTTDACTRMRACSAGGLWWLCTLRWQCRDVHCIAACAAARQGQHGGAVYTHSVSSFLSRWAARGAVDRYRHASGSSRCRRRHAVCVVPRCVVYRQLAQLSGGK